MQIPSLPTDNLYKFMALSGVFLTIVFLLLTIYSIYLKEVKTLEIENRLSIAHLNLKIYEDFSKDELDYIESLSKIIKEKKETMDNMIKNPNALSFDNYNTFLNDKKEIYVEIHKTKTKSNEFMSKYQLEAQENINNEKELHIIEYFYKIFLFIYFIGISAGIYLAYKGFSLWKTKLQNYLDNNVENLMKNE